MSTLLVIFPMVALAQPAAIDSCEATLPVSLRQELPGTIPGYRLVRASDYSREAVERHKKEHAGNSCVGVASSDADGDGFADYAFVVADGKGRTLVVAARNAGGKRWRFSTLHEFGKDDPANLYVDVQKAGSYRDMFDVDPAPSDYEPEPGRVRRYKAVHPGFLTGGIEASGVAFFFDGQRWVHLWLSD